MSTEAWNAEGRAIWERGGKRCARCLRELPDYRDCRTDTAPTQPADEEHVTLCVPCYTLRSHAKRWRTANMGAMVAAGILPKNWRELVW